jgi:hypothetical protein
LAAAFFFAFRFAAEAFFFAFSFAFSFFSFFFSSRRPSRADLTGLRWIPHHLNYIHLDSKLATAGRILGEGSHPAPDVLKDDFQHLV